MRQKLCGRRIRSLDVGGDDKAERQRICSNTSKDLAPLYSGSASLYLGGDTLADHLHVCVFTFDRN